MKMKIFILNLFLILCANGNLAEAYGGGTVMAGSVHTCAIDDEGLKCWEDNGSGQTNVPPLKNLTSVSAGYWHTCAIDDEGVKCWGSNGDGQTKVPYLKNPTSVSAGGSHTCAIDDEGVKCWGGNDYGQANAPHLQNPRSISAGYKHTCAIDDAGVKCWGYDTFDQTKVPPLKNAISVSAGFNHTCVIDDEGVKCWGHNTSGQINIPHLESPTSVSAGTDYTCAIDNEGVKCWGKNDYGQANVPALTNPTSVSAGGSHTCAIEDEDVKCWGYNRYGQSTVPSLIFFWLSRLENLIDRLAQLSTPVRTSFFNSLKPFVNEILKLTAASPVPDQLVHGRYILMALLKLPIETGDSTYYIEKAIPGYISRMKIISEQTGIYGLDQVKDFPVTRLTALKVMQTSLSVMTEFLIAEDKAHVQDIIKLIGLAMSDVSNKQNITNALAAIDVNEAIISKLNHASKTQFLVLTLQTAQQWLKAKIQ